MEVLNVNASKLATYIETNVAIGHKVNGKLSYHMVPFQQCQVKDFEILKDTSFIDKIGHRLCPDFEKLKDLWKVKGSYSNS